MVFALLHVLPKHQTDTTRIWRIANHMKEGRMLPCKAYSYACLISSLEVSILNTGLLYSLGYSFLLSKV